MTVFSPQQLTDPTIEPATLAEIVNTQPELWTAVLTHPNCYPELSSYIRQNLATLGVPQLPAAASPAPQGNASVDQMAAGAKQVAAGAKEYFVHTVAPAAKSAGATLQKAANERGGATSGVGKLTAWAPFALPALAFIAIISLFLPVGSVSGYGFSASVNFFDEEAGGEGIMLLISLLIVIAVAAIALVTGKRWARIAAGSVGILFGLLGAIDGFGTMANIDGTSGASVGAGAVLLAMASTAMMVAAILTLLSKQP